MHYFTRRHLVIVGDVKSETDCATLVTGSRKFLTLAFHRVNATDAIEKAETKLKTIASERAYV